MQSIHQMISHSHQAANPGLGVASSLTKPRAAVGNAAATAGAASPASTPAAAGASTITANDFLTLLVAEMKNQDPTQPTDPSQYISQMVDVNSLQQLIGINQGISSLDTAAGATSPTAGASTGAATAATSAAAAASGTGVDAMLAGLNGAGANSTGTNGTGTSVEPGQSGSTSAWLNAASSLR